MRVKNKITKLKYERANQKCIYQVGCLNIHGLDIKGINKLHLSLIQKNICGHFIFCSAETSLKDDNQLFSLNGPTTYFTCRKVSNKIR